MLSFKRNKSEEAIARGKRNKELRLLWIAYFDKHFPITGKLPARHDTKPLDFDPLREPCTRCGTLILQHRFGMLQTLCPSCKAFNYHAYSNTYSRKRNFKKHRDKIRREGKLARLKRLEKTSAGSLHCIINPPESTQIWPPMGSLVLPSTHTWHGINMRFFDCEFWMNNVLKPQYNCDLIVEENFIGETGKTRRRRRMR